MTPRPRLKRNKGLPDNLTARVKGGVTYYAYTHPLTGKETGFGTDKAKAIESARTLNGILAKSNVQVVKVMGGGDSFSAYLTHWLEKILPTKRVKGKALSVETVAEYKRVVKAFDKALGLTPMATLGQGHIAAYLNTLSSSEVYNKHRALLMQICKYALSDAKLLVNPVANILPRDKTDRVRQRLTLEQYKLIYAQADKVIRLGMELALNLTQRNYDLRSIKFTDLRDDGYLYVVQSKTRKHGKSAFIRIPVSLRTVHSEAGYKTLGDIINACRDDVLSPYVLHEMPERKCKSAEKDHWTQISKKRLSRGFADARNAIGITGDTAPTFYECVSLGMNLRKESGWTLKQVKRLKGHTSEKMSEHYLDGHDFTTIEE